MILGMRTLRVTVPDGTDWLVRVQWQPRWHALALRFGGWRRKRRRRHRDFDGTVDVGGEVGTGSPSDLDGSGPDLPGADLGDDLFVGALVVVGLVVFGAVFWWAAIPLLLVVLDAVALAVLLAAGIAARVLFRRPWTVEAVPRRGARQTVDVVGWRAALRTRDEIAERIRAGHPDPVGVADG
jgi:hypothetical protein